MDCMAFQTELLSYEFLSHVNFSSLEGKSVSFLICGLKLTFQTMLS